jgi:hypothetical protein
MKFASNLLENNVVRITASVLAAAAMASATAKAHAFDTAQCANKGKSCIFNMVRNATLPAACLPKAHARVAVHSVGAIEFMSVSVDHLKPNTDYDFFVIQKPTGPFGMAWYQGDIETDSSGRGTQIFAGRFNTETFIVAAPGVQPLAPQVHNNAFPDAIFGQTQQVGPIHTFHLGLWFNSPADAASVGCPNTVTPFNGEHNAGVQILNTSNFPDQEGPLFSVK